MSSSSNDSKDLNYFVAPAYFHVAYRATAIRNAIIMWISYLPIVFIALCVRREPKIKERYKTTILFSAYAQFVLTLPLTIFYTWIAIAVSQEYETTIFWCSMVKTNTTALSLMSYNAIVAVGFSRMVSLVFNRRVGFGSVFAAFTFCSVFLVANLAYMYVVNTVYSHEMCSPLVYYLEDIPILLHNIYTFLIPLIALVFNLVTVIYLFYLKSSRHAVSNSKKVDELVVAFSLLLQSAIPALTIASKAFFTLSVVWEIKAPAWFLLFTNWASFFTTGLNVVASIIFIKSFQDQFKAMFWIPVKDKIVRPEHATNTAVAIVQDDAHMLVDSDKLDYFVEPAFFHVGHRSIAIRNAIILWVSYLPIFFIALCVRREPKIRERYKTTILFSAYAQFVLTLPLTVFYTWIAIAVSQEIETTIFWCSMLKLNTTALSLMSYNAIVAVGFSRMVSLVFNRRVGLGTVLAAFTFCSVFLVAIVAYMFVVNTVVPHEMCSPLIYYREEIPMLLHNVYTFAIPLIALLLNLTTVIYLFYLRSSRHAVSRSKKVDEIVVALSLLLQSAIPAVTIASKAFFTFAAVWRIKAPAWFLTFTNWASFFTTGLNVVASIILIKSFQDQFKAMFWIPVKLKITHTEPPTNTAVATVHVRLKP